MFGKRNMLIPIMLSLCILIVVALLSTNTYAAREGDLGCEDLTNCDGRASCGSPGTQMGCTIRCKDGTSVTCLKGN